MITRKRKVSTTSLFLTAIHKLIAQKHPQLAKELQDQWRIATRAMSRCSEILNQSCIYLDASGGVFTSGDGKDSRFVFKTAQTVQYFKAVTPEGVGESVSNTTDAEKITQDALILEKLYSAKQITIEQYTEMLAKILDGEDVVPELAELSEGAAIESDEVVEAADQEDA